MCEGQGRSMAVSKPENSANELPPHSDAELQEAEDNLARCLEAYDQGGDEALEDELERINPNPRLAAVGLRRIRTPLIGGGWIHGLVSDQSYLKTISYEDYLKAHPEVEEEMKRIEDPASAEGASQPVDLNPVILNAKGESVGPNYHRDHPEDFPGSSTAPPGNSPK